MKKTGPVAGAGESAAKKNRPGSLSKPPAPKKQASSWRDVLPIHPAAALFPLMSADELRELALDIEKNGLKQPIVLWSPGYYYDGEEDRPRYLLDGRNRLDAMELAGLPVLDDKGECSAWFEQLWEKKEVYKPDTDDTDPDIEPDTDPFAYVISANIRRRHLTVEDKHRIIGDLLKADPSKSDRSIAGTIDASPTTVGKIRTKLEAAGLVSTVDTRKDKRGRQQPAKRKKPTTAAAMSTKVDTEGLTKEQLVEAIHRDLTEGDKAVAEAEQYYREAAALCEAADELGGHTTSPMESRIREAEEIADLLSRSNPPVAERIYRLLHADHRDGLFLAAALAERLGIEDDDHPQDAAEVIETAEEGALVGERPSVGNLIDRSLTGENRSGEMPDIPEFLRRDRGRAP